MIRVLLTCCISIYLVNLFSQEINQDSILQIWENEKLEDTVRLEAYYTYIVKGQKNMDADSQRNQLQELLNFAIATDYRKYQGLAYWQQGRIDLNQHKYIDAGKKLHVAQKIMESTGLEKELGGLHWALGRLYMYFNDYDKSLEHNFAAIEHMKAIDSVNYNSISGVLNNIGNLYAQTEQHDKAIEYYKLAGQNARKVNIVNDIAEHNQIKRYLALGKPDVALKIANQLLRDTQLIEDDGSWRNKQQIKAELLESKGNIYMEMKKHSIARKYFLQWLDVKEDHSQAKSKIGETYLGEGDPNSAINWIEPFYADEYSDNDYRQSQSHNANLLYESYKRLGNSSKALYYLEISKEIKDSLEREGIQKKRALTLLRAELESEMKKDSLENFHVLSDIQDSHQSELVDRDRFRNVILGLCFLLTILALVLFYRYKLSHRTQKLLKLERDMNLEVLKKTLPTEVANELKASGQVSVKEYDLATILFTDFVGFTELTEHGKAGELISKLNMYFSMFDTICNKYGIEKIKTIGDSYMAVGGLPVPTTDSVKNTVLAALEMIQYVDACRQSDTENRFSSFEMRVGLHSGSVIAGIVGTTRYQYDIWGDAVNTASRMESAGEPGKVNISQATYDLIRHSSLFDYEERGEIEVKGKGPMKMWFTFKSA